MVAPPVCTGGTTARTRSSELSWCCTWRSKAQARVRWGHRGRDMVSMAMAVLTTEKRFRLADGAGAYQADAQRGKVWGVRRCGQGGCVGHQILDDSRDTQGASHGAYGPAHGEKAPARGAAAAPTWE